MRRRKSYGPVAEQIRTEILQGQPERAGEVARTAGQPCVRDHRTTPPTSELYARNHLAGTNQDR